VKQVVAIDFRMSETTRQADIILPAAFWYEKADLKYLASFIPYVHLGDRAVAPLGESKPEWEISRASRKRREEAKRRDCRRTATSPTPNATRGGWTKLQRPRPVWADRRGQSLEFVLGYSAPTSKRPLPTCASRAPCASAAHRPGGAAGFFSDYKRTNRWYRSAGSSNKAGWPNSRGGTFYIDHPWFWSAARRCPYTKRRRPPGATTRWC